MSFPTGPHVSLAVLCEQVIEEKDGTLSLIRVVDRLTTLSDRSATPDQMPAMAHNLFLVVGLKGDRARGRHTLHIILEKPSGGRFPAPSQSVQFETGEDKGANLVIRLQMAFDEEGLYWFDIYLDRADNEQSLLTRIPLRIIYQPQQSSGLPLAP